MNTLAMGNVSEDAWLSMWGFGSRCLMPVVTKLGQCCSSMISKWNIFEERPRIRYFKEEGHFRTGQTMRLS